MPSSEQIVNETTSRSGVISEHEQLSSFSHPKNNVMGFVIDSVNVTISFPEENS